MFSFFFLKIVIARSAPVKQEKIVLNKERKQTKIDSKTIFIVDFC